MQENVHAGKGACKIGYMQERCMQDGVHAGKLHAGRETCRKKDRQEGTHKGKRTCRKQQATDFSYWSNTIEADGFYFLISQYQQITYIIIFISTDTRTDTNMYIVNISISIDAKME